MQAEGYSSGAGRRQQCKVCQLVRFCNQFLKTKFLAGPTSGPCATGFSGLHAGKGLQRVLQLQRPALRREDRPDPSKLLRGQNFLQAQGITHIRYVGGGLASVHSLQGQPTLYQESHQRPCFSLPEGEQIQ